MCGGGFLCWRVRVCRLLGGREGVYGLWVFVSVSKITFGNMVLISFKWLFAANFCVDVESFKRVDVGSFFVTI